MREAYFVGPTDRYDRFVSEIASTDSNVRFPNGGNYATNKTWTPSLVQYLCTITMDTLVYPYQINDGRAGVFGEISNREIDIIMIDSLNILHSFISNQPMP